MCVCGGGVESSNVFNWVNELEKFEGRMGGVFVFKWTVIGNETNFDG